MLLTGKVPYASRFPLLALLWFHQTGAGDRAGERQVRGGKGGGDNGGSTYPQAACPTPACSDVPGLQQNNITMQRKPIPHSKGS